MNSLYRWIPLCCYGHMCTCASTSLPPSHTLPWVFDSYGYRTDSASAKSGFISKITSCFLWSSNHPHQDTSLWSALRSSFPFASEVVPARLGYFFNNLVLIVCIWSTVVNLESRTDVVSWTKR
ncbi:hypothetical protein K503DRAFT_266541 [Rhizopogon vinicolor AM-OR11-026]|uniref:Uncharacterized protein n=1 Tax=Rhizopogon vinicolor AM-OR11-026 TaxID=1314800 RepID=A0A1B7MWF4_9AGAM|nr:hypothetical protein K503DRAFT_266541 [Rhizopogon vinicolor AM-OR11-026]